MPIGACRSVRAPQTVILLTPMGGAGVRRCPIVETPASVFAGRSIRTVRWQLVWMVFRRVCALRELSRPQTVLSLNTPAPGRAVGPTTVVSVTFGCFLKCDASPRLVLACGSENDAQAHVVTRNRVLVATGLCGVGGPAARA